jgi:hypothetical protein
LSAADFTKLTYPPAGFTCSFSRLVSVRGASPQV